jgi:hypothetical protein
MVDSSIKTQRAQLESHKASAYEGYSDYMRAEQARMERAARIARVHVPLFDAAETLLTLGWSERSTYRDTNATEFGSMAETESRRALGNIASVQTIRIEDHPAPTSPKHLAVGYSDN